MYEIYVVVVLLAFVSIMVVARKNADEWGDVKNLNRIEVLKFIEIIRLRIEEWDVKELPGQVNKWSQRGLTRLLNELETQYRVIEFMFGLTEQSEIEDKANEVDYKWQRRCGLPDQHCQNQSDKQDD